MENYVYYNDRWMTVVEFYGLQPKNPKTVYAELIKEAFGDYMHKIPISEINKALKK